jgi:DNA-binding GntR family transcriptional regulator
VTKVTINVVILLMSSIRLPMHDLWLYLDYGDSKTSGILPFNNDDISNSLSQNGYSISHQYIKQGNYTITGYIKSNLSARSLQMDVYVWAILITELARNVGGNWVVISHIYYKNDFSIGKRVLYRRSWR